MQGPYKRQRRDGRGSVTEAAEMGAMWLKPVKVGGGSYQELEETKNGCFLKLLEAAQPC